MTAKQKAIIALLFAFCAVTSTTAQKAFKTIRASLKANNPAEALKQVEALEGDTVLRIQPKLYRYGVEANMAINDVENEKIYLKQAYDTVRFFNSTAGIFDYVLKCDKAERQQLATEGKKLKYHREHGALLHSYYNNIGAAGRYFFSRKKYAEAMRFLSLYIETPKQPIWGSDKATMQTRAYADNAYLYLKSAYLKKDYAEVERYKELVLGDTSTQCRNALEYLSLSSEARQDTAGYVAYLGQGLASYPEDSFFFTRLVDTYARRGDYARTLFLADSMLCRDSTNLLYLEAKSLALLNLKRYAEAVELSKRCLQLDSTLVETNFYIGAAYCNLAAAITLPVNINSKTYRKAAGEQKAYYAAAQPYMERYRQLSPDTPERWAPLLYRIYLSMNKGQQFEEIDKILKALPQGNKSANPE